MENENINPWLHIWVHTRKTMRSILNTDPKKTIIWLAIIGGVISAIVLTLFLWVRYPAKEEIRHIAFILTLCVIGGLIGIFHLYFGGWLYTLTGSWIKGKGTFTEVKCAVGWSNYPFIVANILSIIGFFVVPNPWLQGIFGLLNGVASIWGIIIFLKLIGEAHRFSAWKSLLAVIIAAVLIFVVFMIIALIIPLLTPLFQ